MPLKSEIGIHTFLVPSMVFQRNLRITLHLTSCFLCMNTSSGYSRIIYLQQSFRKILLNISGCATSAMYNQCRHGDAHYIAPSASLRGAHAASVMCSPICGVDAILSAMNQNNNRGMDAPP